jgi:hypothetical protein
MCGMPFGQRHGTRDENESRNHSSVTNGHFKCREVNEFEFFSLKLRDEIGYLSFILFARAHKHLDTRGQRDGDMRGAVSFLWHDRIM